MAAAGLWGLAEATVFFIVPDVLLSWVALKHPGKALRACLWALGGALLGGAAIFYLGRSNPEPVRELFAALPGISDAMIGNVSAQLRDTGLPALFIGPLIGTPYKIYALEAAALGFSPLLFLLVSVPARVIRFLLVASVFALLGDYLRRFTTLNVIRAMHVVGWAAFYSWYFYVMSVPG